MTLAKFKKLSKYKNLLFKKSTLKFYGDEAFNMCTIKGVITNEGDAEGYMVRKMLGLGFKYSLHYIGANKAADPINTGYFKVNLGRGLIFHAYFERQDLV